MIQHEHWTTAIENFAACLPRECQQWVVVFQDDYHREVVAQVKRRLGAVESFGIETTPRERIIDCALRHRDDDRVGYVELMLTPFAYSRGGKHIGEDVQVFSEWPQSRIRRCCDVWDDNFCDLFAESPYVVQERCDSLLGALATVGELDYFAPVSDRAELRIRCGGSRWGALTALEGDHVEIPNGEVNCIPDSVDGFLQVDGWIIGTLPFGVKHGRVQTGDITLALEGGKIVEVRGQNSELVRDFKYALDRVPRLGVVSEIGLGQSEAVERMAEQYRVGYTWHEFKRGLHLGFGAEIRHGGERDQGFELEEPGHHLDIVFAHGRLQAGDLEILAW